MRVGGAGHVAGRSFGGRAGGCFGSDIAVDRPMGESYTGRDVQLERAVQELMNQLRSPRARAGSER